MVVYSNGGGASVMARSLSARRRPFGEKQPADGDDYKRANIVAIIFESR